MIITKKHLSRRTFIRGTFGAAVALPLLESMVPALTAQSRTAASTPFRFGAIYMPNGQKVPICVIEAERDDLRDEGEAHYSYPASVMGGGYPVICDIQNQEHIASVACLVTDGSKTYALTNRHVVSDPGTRLSAIVGRMIRMVHFEAGQAGFDHRQDRGVVDDLAPPARQRMSEDRDPTGRPD